jgi:hypothetical protein
MFLHRGEVLRRPGRKSTAPPDRSNDYWGRLLASLQAVTRFRGECVYGTALMERTLRRRHRLKHITEKERKSLGTSQSGDPAAESSSGTASVP